MSSFSRSKKGILVVAGIITIIAVLLTIPTLFLNSNSIQICDDGSKAISITRAGGFVTIKSRSHSPTLQQDTDVSIQPAGIYEFVLKPGSVGHVKMTYDFCPNAFGLQPSRTANYSELNELFQSRNSTNKEVIYKLNDNFNDTISGNGAFQLLTAPTDQLLIEDNPAKVGLQIYPSDLTKLNAHAVSVTYTISAEPSVNKTTYVFTNFYGICPGELLTVGESPNEHSLKWATGTFNGCSG